MTATPTTFSLSATISPPGYVKTGAGLSGGIALGTQPDAVATTEGSVTFSQSMPAGFLAASNGAMSGGILMVGPSPVAIPFSTTAYPGCCQFINWGQLYVQICTSGGDPIVEIPPRGLAIFTPVGLPYAQIDSAGGPQGTLEYALITTGSVSITDYICPLEYLLTL